MIFDTVSVEEIIGYTFKDKILLRQCFTHASYAYENKNSKSNEVLEFFGDSILGFVITEYLYKNVPGDEGVLSQKRASMVSRQPLQDVVFSLGIEKYMLLGGGLKIKENSNEKMYSSLFESLVAGIYIDGGINPAKKFILDNLVKKNKNIKNVQSVKNNKTNTPKNSEETHKAPVKNKPKINKDNEIKSDISNENYNNERNADYKSELQELVQKYKLGNIEYVLLDKKGPDHAPNFKVSVSVGDEKMAEGEGQSKKIAEMQAAGVALYKLKSKFEKKEERNYNYHSSAINQNETKTVNENDNFAKKTVKQPKHFLSKKSSDDKQEQKDNKKAENKKVFKNNFSEINTQSSQNNFTESNKVRKTSLNNFSESSSKNKQINKKTDIKPSSFAIRIGSKNDNNNDFDKESQDNSVKKRKPFHLSEKIFSKNENK